MVKVAKTVEVSKTRQRRVKKPDPSSTNLQDLNTDVLIEIFKYLDVKQLTKLGKVANRFKDIIVEHVIPLKIVNFSELHHTTSVQKMFQMFGRSMTRIAIGADDIQMTHLQNTKFAEFLQLVVEYCEPGRLQQIFFLDFGIGEDKVIPSELLTAVGPFLENVHTMHFNLPPKQMPFVSQFIKAIPKHNLRKLFLHDIQFIGEWLNVASLPKLQNLHICMGRGYFGNTYDNLNMNRLKAYIAQKPQLKQFDYTGKNHEQILIELSVNVPKLTSIGPVNNRMVAFDNNNNNNNNGIWNLPSLHEKWKFLSAFTNLTEFSLESQAANFANCGEIFRILADRNTIESLELRNETHFISQHSPVNSAHLHKLTKVKKLRLVDLGHGGSDLFMDQLFENLTALEVCSFEGCRMKQAPILSLVQRAKNIRTVNVGCKVTSVSARFYRRLLNLRRSHKLNNGPLVMNLDEAVVNSIKEELPPRRYNPNIVLLNPKKT